MTRKDDGLDIKAVLYKSNKVNIRINFLDEDTVARRLEFHLHNHKTPNGTTVDYYKIGPSAAFYWPVPFSEAFYDKLDEDIQKIINQKESRPIELGFLYLDLHEKNIDQEKESEQQDWEHVIEQHLNRQSLPIVLVTYSVRLQKIFCIMNKAAVHAGFVKPNFNG